MLGPSQPYYLSIYLLVVSMCIFCLISRCGVPGSRRNSMNEFAAAVRLRGCWRAGPLHKSQAYRRAVLAISRRQIERLPFYVIHCVHTHTYHTHTPSTNKREHHFRMNRPATKRGLTVANLSLLNRAAPAVFVSAPSTTSHKIDGGAAPRKAAARAGWTCRCTARSRSTSQCCRHQRRRGSGTRTRRSLADSTSLWSMCTYSWRSTSQSCRHRRR